MGANSLTVGVLLSLAMLLVGCDSGRSKPYSGGLPGGSFSTQSADNEVSNADTDADEAEAARDAFNTATQELQSAVDDLRVMPWRTQMGEIRDRLEDAETALSELEAVRPNSAAVANARSQLEEVRSNMGRLHFENWRHVVPDLFDGVDDIANSAMEFDNDEE